MITEHLSFILLYMSKIRHLFDRQIEYPHAKFTCTAKHFRILPINKIQISGFFTFPHKYVRT